MDGRTIRAQIVLPSIVLPEKIASDGLLRILPETRELATSLQLGARDQFESAEIAAQK